VREQEMAGSPAITEMSKENYKSLLDKKMAAGMSLDMESGTVRAGLRWWIRAQCRKSDQCPTAPLFYAGAAGPGAACLPWCRGSASNAAKRVLGEWSCRPAPWFWRGCHLSKGRRFRRKKLLSRGRWFSRKKALAGASAASSFPAAFSIGSDYV